jgi:hypothetical protein
MLDMGRLEVKVATVRCAVLATACNRGANSTIAVRTTGE